MLRLHNSFTSRAEKHLLLWSRLIARLGPQAPHLIIVGSQGFGARDILAPLAAHPDLCRRVHLVAGLSSPALAALVRGATAMLCPSLTEGFGLPLLEANALGVPSIASDIPSHREIGNGSTQFLPCSEDRRWEEAILALAANPVSRPFAVAETLTETDYCAEILSLIRSFPGSKQPDAMSPATFCEA